MKKTPEKQLQWAKKYIEENDLVQLHLRVTRKQSAYLKELAKKEGKSVTRMVLEHFNVP